MAAVGEAQDALDQFEGDIHVDAAVGLVGVTEQFSRVAEPQELAVKPEVQREQAAIESEKKIFASALNCMNLPAFREARELRGCLRFRGDGMQNVDAANPATLDERAECARDSFDLREFRHQSDRFSRGGL
jgi:hypothetical protein